MKKHLYHHQGNGRLPILLLGLMTILIAYGLKYHYSRAQSEDLVWILKPTATLVEYFSEMEFENNPGTGFISPENRVIIAPSCAGVNFMITMFCMTSFYGLCSLRNTTVRHLWPGISLVWAYLSALFANTLRIVASVHLYSADIYTGGLTPERIHRLAGIVLYVLFLLLTYAVLEWIIRGLNRSFIRQRGFPLPKTGGLIGRMCADGIPVLWYFVMAVGIPLLNRAYQKGGARVIEHFLMVISVGGLVFLLFFLVRLGCRCMADRIKSARPDNGSITGYR